MSHIDRLLENKVILVTGGGSGIGRATCVILAKAGARVVAADYDRDSALETQTMVEDQEGAARSCGANVADENDVKAMVEFTIAQFGRLDGAFNNAGVPMQNKLLEDLDESDWNKVLDVNLKGMFYCMKHEIRAMRNTAGGAIVNTASANALVGNPMSAEYVASKHGVLGITRAAACEAAITGVRVNAVLPGLIKTPMIADLLTNPDFSAYAQATLSRHTIGRFGEPEDVAYAVNGCFPTKPPS